MNVQPQKGSELNVYFIEGIMQSKSIGTLNNKFFNQINISQSCPWQHERNGPGPNANYNSKKNLNR